MGSAVRTGSRLPLIGEQTEALQFHSAGAFGLDTPPTLLAIADEVIE